MTHASQSPRTARRLATAVSTTDDVVDLAAWVEAYGRMVLSFRRADTEATRERQARALPEAS